LDIKSVKGTQDIFGSQALLYDYIETQAKNLALQIGCEPIMLPILEYLELFERGVGEDTDVVSKEMFAFEDRKHRKLCLRPEGTAQTVRFVLENGKLRDSLKRYFYMGSMFRAEKPQKGRQREFHQIGIEIFGEESVSADLEVIEYAVLLLKRLSILQFSLSVNSIGCKNCRPLYLEKLKQFLKIHENMLCQECQYRAQKNPLRLFDCKNASCQALLKDAPFITESLCQECSTHFTSLKEGLEVLEIPYKVNPRLVRGLDYYTQTVFEVTLPGLLGSQDAVAGGGRYNYLVETFSAKDFTPAVGLAFGVERVMIALENNKEFLDSLKTQLDYIVVSDSFSLTQALKIASYLKGQGKNVIVDSNDRGLNKKLKRADRIGAKWIIILEKQEKEKGIFKLKNMLTGEQKDYDLNDFRGL
jgi:histidyl-tRNA synthetase